MKKFEIIEEGRLSKSEMNAIVGGILYCSPVYTVEKKCEFDGQPSTRAVCTGTYISCSCEEVSCAPEVGGYTGPQGPEGIGATNIYVSGKGVISASEKEFNI